MKIIMAETHIAMASGPVGTDWMVIQSEIQLLQSNFFPLCQQRRGTREAEVRTWTDDLDT